MSEPTGRPVRSTIAIQMILLPIVARELRVASRRRSTYFGRIAAAFVPIAVAGFWLPVLAAQFTTSQGKLLFSVLSILAFAYCLLAGTRVTSDTISAEKRDGTIGFLFLTDLKGYDIILGKLVSSSLNAFYGLLGIVPVLALALLLGGVTFQEVQWMALLFCNTLFFSLAVGIFASTLSRNDRRAMFATFCIILVVTATPYACAVGIGLRSLINGGGAATFWLDMAPILRVSPCYPLQLLGSSYFGRFYARDFYTALLTVQLLAWLLLGLASFIVPRVCRERPPGQLGMRWLHFRNRWSYGKPSRRAAFRRRLLNRNAFYWLAARDRIKAHYVWFFVGALGVIWVWSSWMMEGFLLDWDVSFWLLVLIYLFFKVWLTSEVCTRLVEDRDSGAFELLLSSPLDLKELAHGQTLALWRQFGRPVIAVLLLSYLLLRAALRSPHSGVADGEIQFVFFALMLMLVADLVTLKWLGGWKAINIGQTNRATMAACTRVLLLPTILFIVAYSIASVVKAALGSPPAQEEFDMWRGRAIALWLAIGLLNDLYFGVRARWLFLHRFREVATLRYAAPAGLEPFTDFVRGLRQRLPAPLQARDHAVRPALLNWKLWLIGGPALALALALLAIGVHRESLRHKLRAKLDAIRAAGEPVQLPDLLASGQVPPGGENAADLFQKAMPRLRSPYQLRNRFEWPGPIGPLNASMTASLDQLMATNRQALQLLHAGAKLSRCQFQLFLPTTASQIAVWQTFGPLHAASEVLQFEALYQSSKGDSARAVEAVSTLLAIARDMGQQPYFAGQQYRHDFLLAAIRALERVLNDVEIAPAVALELGEALGREELDCGGSLVRGLLSDRCFAIEEHFSPRSTSPRGWGPPPSGLEKASQDIVRFVADTLGARDEALLGYLEITDEAIRRAKLIEEHPREALRSASPIDPTNQSGMALSNQFGLERLFQQTDLLAELRVARTVLAVERFRAARHRLPEELSELCPEFLPSMPLDPFVTLPLKFKRLERGYVLYSVGRDGQDNSGTPPPSSNAARQKGGFDLVFRVLR